MRALSLLTMIMLCGCGFAVPQYTSDNCDDTSTEEMFSVSAERLVDGEAQFNIEFIPDWGDAGDYGWHMPFFWDEEDVLEMSIEQDIVAEIIEAMTNFGFEDVTCVRFNISYGDNCETNPSGAHCRWLCEGNGESARLSADVELDWFSQDWTVGTWSDPSGEGCSALACADNIYDITAD